MEVGLQQRRVGLPGRLFGNNKIKKQNKKTNDLSVHSPVNPMWLGREVAPPAWQSHGKKTNTFSDTHTLCIFQIPLEQLRRTLEQKDRKAYKLTKRKRFIFKILESLTHYWQASSQPTFYTFTL